MTLAAPPLDPRRAREGGAAAGRRGAGWAEELAERRS